jgi:hypothetical protein
MHLLTLPAHAATIQITTVPAYNTTQDVSGTVTGITPSTVKVALFIYVDGWYTKPSFATPTVPVLSNGTWTADITGPLSDNTSTRIAAVLVPSTATPPQANGESYLPEGLYAQMLAYDFAFRGTSDHVISFSGYDWAVKKSTGVVGPGPNYFSDSSSDVYTDSSGLHLSIAHRGGNWYSSEVILQEYFGYGTYVFTTRGRVDLLDPNIVAGFFTWSSGAPAPNREIDFEYSRWGNSLDLTNGQFVVQPYDTPGNLQRYTVSLSAAQQELTHVLEWTTGTVTWKVYNGDISPASPPAGSLAGNWSYSGAGVPTPGLENFRINFWLFGGQPPVSGVEDSIVVKSFRYYAPGATVPVDISKWLVE